MKLIAFDIDGTTINDMRRVKSSTLEALVTMKKEGYLLVPTTGRSLDAIPKSILNLGVCDYAITSNGARITNLKTHEDLKTTLMKPHVAMDILNVIRKYRLAVSIHVNGVAVDSSYAQRLFRRIAFHNDFSRQKVVRNLHGHVEIENLELEKIQLFSLSKEKLKRVKKDLDKISEIAYPMSSKRYFEITAQGAEKGIALEWLCSLLNVPLDEVCAIGDDSNDISMFKKVGFAIAMGNAKDNVSTYADFITLSNNNHGFKVGMEKVLEISNG